MDQQALKEFVQANPKLVSMKPAGTDMFVLKYRKTVFYDNLWNDFLEECRGTIVDADFNVVQRPFQKIYNFGIEAKAPVLDDDIMVTAYRKANGFMVAVSWHGNDLLVSTTGSTDNDYVGYAKEMMLKHMCWEDWQIELCKYPDMTFMFECVHPADPHIIVEKPGMYFLGWREKDWNAEMRGWGLADAWHEFGTTNLKCHPVQSWRCTVGELKKMSKECRHEGFVAYTEDHQAFKIKSPYYLTNKWVARNPRTDKLVDLNNDIKKNIDEEYYHLIDAIRANIVEYTAMDEQARLAWVRNFVGAV